MSDVLRPIIGIENRTAQEVFDIMSDRFRHRLSNASTVESEVRPITMQDVRLAVGEGKLSAADVLAGCNAELRRRGRLASTVESRAVENCAALLDDWARAEDFACAVADEPADKGRCAIIAAEFRRAANAIRALPLQQDTTDDQ